MLDCSTSYRSAINGDSRRMHVRAIIDLIDPDIVYGEIDGSAGSAYSKPAQLYDKVMQPDRLATLERNHWLLNGSYGVYPDDPDEMSAEAGFQSLSLSGADGEFNETQTVCMTFSNLSILQAMSVYFPGAADGVAKSFTVEISATDGAVYYAQHFDGNTLAAINLAGFTVYNPATITIKVDAWSLPYRRMRIVEIVPGIYETWGSDKISAISVRQQVNFADTALPYGSASITIDNSGRRFEPRNKNSIFESIAERQAIPVQLGPQLPDGSIEYKQVGVYYQCDGGWSTSENGLTITWDLVDILGLLADRDYIVPDTLPTTLSGWLADIVAQLGVNFVDRWRCDTGYADAAVTARATSDLSGKKCGEVLRYACMAAGCYPIADAATGYLSAASLRSVGSIVTLDNLTQYPVISANADLGYIQFQLNDDSKTVYRVGGNTTASDATLSVNNPFISSQAAAMIAAKNILACYGGQQIKISGRGDPASECGDVDIIQLDESQATAARRLSQTFSFSNGIMSKAPATFLQADGSYLYNSRVYLTNSGTWTAPAGVTQLFIILVGGGDGGNDGTAGTMDSNGEAGADGQGGRVFAATISINDGQSLTYSCGEGGAANGGLGTETLLGSYSSLGGKRYDGYADIRSGDVYARDGIKAPLPGYGDGGKGGKAGRKGRTTTDSGGKEHTTRPTAGGVGVAGQSGCIVIWYSVSDLGTGG